MSDAKINISEASVRIEAIEVPSRDVAEYLRALPEDEREQAVIYAVEVGVFCSKDAVL